jgi:hypothetical protein
LLLLVKNNKPKKLEKLNGLGKKQSPTRSGMQGLYETAWPYGGTQVIKLMIGADGL